MRLGEPLRTGRTGNRWRIAGGAVEPVSAGSTGDLVAVPTEDVLLLTVDLPLSGRRRQLAALPFAIEDRIADPLDAVHLALGQPLAPQRHLVGIVRHAVMRGWIALLDDMGLAHASLVPDALLLPLPPAGFWTVRSDGPRTLVRVGDGTGFAIATAALVAAWNAGGRPACIADGGPLPADLVAAGEDVQGAEVGTPPLDLRQGAYLARVRRDHSLARRVATVAGLGVAAHAAIAATDTVALRFIADQRAAQARTLVAPLLPTPLGDEDPAVAAAPLLSAAGSGGAPDRLLPLLARVSGALAPIGPVAMRSLAYDRAAARLTLEVDPAAAPRVAATLGTAGVRARASGATVVVEEGAR